ncbi:MAG: SpoIIE family protein phosphatase [Edaphobacter sp.]|uniref:SpoIIE family protein phosphatase n=1 Tax=Edaphobacter sp. TaxID=1934404 RepID=UPI0023905E46|nr:SpoIIE family protein phosphatase [Edaphobacter sp.]MDE1175193.1 SpoIIE family protein phosphatase [Edaphobacter sp.]
MNVLVVEEDLNTQNMLLGWLKDWGHQVTTAKDGAEAKLLLQNDGYELLLSDWTLPGLDALELCREIRERPGSHYCYIILYTLKAGEIDFVAGMDAGADDFVSIPLEAGRLRVRIRAAERILTLRQELAEQNASLNRLNEKLGTAYRTIQSDLQAASALQAGLMPTIFDVHPCFRLDWLVIPSSFLAGDNLNYFMMQDRYLVFYHLDVAGHGIPSALLSVTLNHLLSPQPGSPMVRFDPQLELKRIVPPIDVVGELNRRFQPQGDGYFTMIYGVLDTQTCEVRFCQAGHPIPLQCNQRGEVVTVGEGGFPVGLWPDMTYEETTTVLPAGERLLLYSDGVLECTNPEGVAYSLDQLKQQLSASMEVSPKAALELIQRDLERWCEGNSFPDDVSMLIIESK